jgi:hypothetical protein
MTRKAVAYWAVGFGMEHTGCWLTGWESQGITSEDMAKILAPVRTSRTIILRFTKD